MSFEHFLAEYGVSEFTFPAIAGMYRGKSLAICGDAACVWDDLERAGFRCDKGNGSVARAGWDIMAVNKIVETLPGNIEHAYSNEPELMKAFIAARRNEYRQEFDPIKHTHSCNKGAMWKWPWRGMGTSALGACLTAVALGYDKSVLCGVPLDDGSHNGEPPWRKCKFSSGDVADPTEGGINMVWRNAIKFVLKGKVKSMSGRTAKWL